MNSTTQGHDDDDDNHVKVLNRITTVSQWHASATRTTTCLNMMGTRSTGQLALDPSSSHPWSSTSARIQRQTSITCRTQKLGNVSREAHVADGHDTRRVHAQNTVHGAMTSRVGVVRHREGSEALNLEKNSMLIVTQVQPRYSEHGSFSVR